METEKSIVKMAETKLPKFVEDAYDSIEKMESFAKILLDSRLVPHHFYEQLPDKKPDFTKGKVPAVVAVLIQGYQLQLPPLTALQHIIPVNGLLSIKGDLAKSMIFNSGKLKAGTWLEEEFGSIDDGNLVVKITATRSDNGQTLSRSFSVAQAKRAGLWITEQQAGGPDGWKYKASAWWKYPARMINYRALGFLARDMFPDVMAGIYTTEEAMDLPKDTVEVIETESGAKLTLPDKDHAKGRSDKMTGRVADKIKSPEFAPIKSNVSDAVVVNEDPVNVQEPIVEQNEESPFIASHGSVEYLDGKEIDRTAEQGTAERYTLEGMEKMDTEVLKEIVMADMDMMEASELIPGRNTNKKLREIIFAHQNNGLREYVAAMLPKPSDTPAEPPADTAKGEIPINRDFDKQKEAEKIDAFLSKETVKVEPKTVSGNKYGIAIPEEIPRDFSIVKGLFNALASIKPPISSARYTELASKLNILVAFPDKEVFLKNATAKMVCELLDSN
jgi:hypothetical protein